MWNCSQKNATETHQCEVNIDSDNGLVPQATTWANVDPELCCHMTTIMSQQIGHLSRWQIFYKKLFYKFLVDDKFR